MFSTCTVTNLTPCNSPPVQADMQETIKLPAGQTPMKPCRMHSTAPPFFEQWLSVTPVSFNQLGGGGGGGGGSINTCIYPSVHTLVYEYVNKHARAHTHTYPHARTHTIARTYSRTHVHARTHAIAHAGRAMGLLWVVLVRSTLKITMEGGRGGVERGRGGGNCGWSRTSALCP